MLGASLIFTVLALGVYELYRMREDFPVHLTGTGNAFREFSYVAVFLTAALTLRLTRETRQVLALPVGLLLLLAWCAMSIGWAVEPLIAFRRLGMCIIIMWTLFICVEHAGFELTTKTMRWALVITLAINYGAMLFPEGVQPTTGVGVNAELAGEWRGIMAQKNFAGAACAFTIILYVFAANVERSVKAAICLAAAYFLYRTESKTSMGLLAFSLLAGFVFYGLHPRQRKWLIPLILAGFFAGVLLAVHEAKLLYDPSAFTGRSQIWLVLFTYAHDHLWLGAGFGSFWDIGNDSPVYQYSRSWVSNSVASGHNGYLDILVQLGLPGLILTVLAMVAIPGYKLLTNANIPRRQGGLLAAFFVFCIGHNFTESSILYTDYIVELFLLIVIALIYQIDREGTRQAVRSRRVRPLIDLGFATPGAARAQIVANNNTLLQR